MAREVGDTRHPAVDRTIYWTQSFYIPVGSADFAPNISAQSDEFVAWLRDGRRPTHWGKASSAAECIDVESRALRQAIEPLFNDVADRSRLGRIDDFLFAGQNARDVTLTLPSQIEWMTEIQPKQDGALVGRRSRVLDDDFIGYPRLIEEALVSGGKHHLDAEYWDRVRGDNAGAKPSAEMAKRELLAHTPRESASGLPDAAERLTYLFLAGFNQNIIDFMNQEASEILDSLDPIYPRSNEQEAEGFFIRYANARAMITYVPRSRTLEVGNDFIGTCPYAFLIHALSMHNEVLTRAQEKATLVAIRQVVAWIDEAREAEVSDAAPGRHSKRAVQSAASKALSDAEAMINATRIDAFLRFDQHRYANPFRYDTERDVFEAMEQLRGTSRLKEAYKAALEALDEQTRDIHRIRKEREEDESASRERRMSYIFSFLGFTGITSLILGTDDFLRKYVAWPFATLTRPSGLVLALIYWIMPAAVIFLIIRLLVSEKR